MKLARRQFLHLAAGATASPALSRVARASLSRAAGARDRRLGQAFVIENRPGAGTNIATEAVVRSPADGYTLSQVTSSAAWNATLYKRLNFNFISDIAPIAGIYRQTGVMEVNPSFPAKTVAEFIAHARANPGKLNMASTGNGSATHITANCSR
jgi:tripartite-type tricarboxylate transporter receptor subunit TctC